jgi:hypothetical protein
MKKLCWNPYTALIAVSWLTVLVSSCANHPVESRRPEAGVLSQPSAISIARSDGLSGNWSVGCFTPSLWTSETDIMCNDWENCRESQSVAGENGVDQSTNSRQDR